MMPRLDVAPAGVSVRESVPGRSRERALGRWGTVARVLVGSTLVVLATVVWRADWLELLIGLVVLPTVATRAAARRRYRRAR